VLIDATADWLMSQALGEHSMQHIFSGCCDRLRAAGVPISRGHLAFRTLHPLFSAVSLTWRPGQPLDVVEHRHSVGGEEFARSPLHYLVESGLPSLRRRLRSEADTREFPVLKELWSQGATDYLAFLVPFGTTDAANSGISDGIVGSWTADRADGFGDGDIRALQRIERRLAVACKVNIKDQIARNVLTAYLGAHSGQQVFEGKIQRGDGETIYAVIWFCDLRDSTRLAATLSRQDFLDTLNEFFECMAGAVLSHGGEVLRFIGDAVLAIFPMQAHAVVDPSRCPIHRAACEQALTAARDALSRLAEQNEKRKTEGRPVLGGGVALHVGDVMYGNIGVPERVEFSVIGPAANTAARLESLCKALHSRLVVSSQYASVLPESWHSLGEQRLAGMDSEVEVFTLDEFTEGQP
jgi:adenylate cyclase